MPSLTLSTATLPAMSFKMASAKGSACPMPVSYTHLLRDVPELKQAVCDYYARRFGVEGITPDMVASCNGTQEGVGHLGLALLDPGDTILVPDPCYPCLLYTSRCV